MKIISSIAIFFILFTLAVRDVRGEVIDKVIAIVNDDIITLKDLEGYIHLEQKKQFTSVNEYLRNLQLREKLDIFIESMLLKQQARRFNITVTDSDIESVIENIKKQNLITDAELRDQLKKDNVTYEQFTEGLRMNLLRTKVLMRVLSTEINITENTLKSYYDSHLELFRDEELHLQQIFISGQRRDIEERANRAYAKLKGGTSFAEVARNFSDDPSASQGGDIGFVKRSDLIPTLRESLNNLATGSFTEIVPTPYGLNILKLVEVKQSDILPFETVKDAVHEHLAMEESNKRYREYIERLKKSSYIEVKI